MVAKRALAVIVVAVATRVGAQPSADHAKAVELFDDGRRLMNNHDPAAACDKFAESIRLEPLAPGTMLNLGLCHEQLGHHKSALYWFRKAQVRATETDPPLSAYEQEAREHTARLAAMVATIKIDVPTGAQVSIDDEIVRPEDYAHVEIDPGHHVLVAIAASKTFRKELDVTGRGGQTVAVVFDPPPTTPPPTAETPEPTSNGWQRRTAFYVGGGAVGLLGCSLALTLYEKQVYDDHKDAALGGDASALAETQHATKIARDYGTGLAIAGLVAAGVAGYLFYTAPDKPVITPAVGAGQVGAVVMGRF